MRIASSALVGMAVTLCRAIALAQSPAPGPAEGRVEVAPPPAPALPPAPLAPAPLAPARPPLATTPPLPVTPATGALPIPPEVGPTEEHPDLAGFRDGFYIRDARDLFRFYPHLLAQLDVSTSFGPGVGAVPGSAGDTSTGLAPRLVLRRVRLGFDAEILRRWSVTALFELAGGQPLGNAAGTSESSAAGAGMTPSAASGRYAGVQTVGVAPYPTDVFVNYSLCRCFNLQIGQLRVPFSLDNRIDDDAYALLERPVAMHNFVVPTPRDLGGVLWGELGPRIVSYELGVFGGDGQNRPSVDARVDFMGRVFVRPFAGSGSGDLRRFAQIGVSARHGDRDPTKVGYDVPALTTGQGFVLWKPSYTDSLGRLVHVVPSGAQNEIGGELRLQAGRLAFQGEAYYVANETREALDGYQLTHSERFGRLLGVGWYAQLSAWPFGDAFLTPEPGIYRPRHLDLGARAPSRAPHGLEVVAIASGIDASYKGATRLASTADLNTPNGAITIYQLGVGANYWHTKHAHVGVYYMAYLTPHSGTGENQAVVPDDLVPGATSGSLGTGHVLHELSARVALAF